VEARGASVELEAEGLLLDGRGQPWFAGRRMLCWRCKALLVHASHLEVVSEVRRLGQEFRTRHVRLFTTGTRGANQMHFRRQQLFLRSTSHQPSIPIISTPSPQLFRKQQALILSQFNIVRARRCFAPSTTKSVLHTVTAWILSTFAASETFITRSASLLRQGSVALRQLGKDQKRRMA